MHFRPAQLFVTYVLPDGTFHEGRPGEIQSGTFRHHELVAEHGQIPAAGDAVSHDGGDLRHAHGGEDGVIAEDAAEIVLVGKDFVLQRQHHAGRIDEVNQRQPIHHGDPLRPQHFFGRHGKERAGLHGRVVGDNHEAPPGHDADAANHARRRSRPPFAVHFPSGKPAELEKRTAAIDQPSDPLAGGESVFLMLPRNGLLPAPLGDPGPIAAEGLEQRLPSARDGRRFRISAGRFRLTRRHATPSEKSAGNAMPGGEFSQRAARLRGVSCQLAIRKFEAVCTARPLGQGPCPRNQWPGHNGHIVRSHTPKILCDLACSESSHVSGNPPVSGC